MVTRSFLFLSLLDMQSEDSCDAMSGGKKRSFFGWEACGNCYGSFVFLSQKAAHPADQGSSVLAHELDLVSIKACMYPTMKNHPRAAYITPVSEPTDGCLINEKMFRCAGLRHLDRREKNSSSAALYGHVTLLSHPDFPTTCKCACVMLGALTARMVAR